MGKRASFLNHEFQVRGRGIWKSLPAEWAGRSKAKRDAASKSGLVNQVGYIALCWDRLLRRAGLRAKVTFTPVCALRGKPRKKKRALCCGQYQWKRVAVMASEGGPRLKGFRSLRTTFANLTSKAGKRFWILTESDRTPLRSWPAGDREFVKHAQNLRGRLEIHARLLIKRPKIPRDHACNPTPCTLTISHRAQFTGVNLTVFTFLHMRSPCSRAEG